MQAMLSPEMRAAPEEAAPRHPKRALPRVS
jgi:hypothetical protein